MNPLNQSSLTFINKCECIVDYDILEKAMLWITHAPLKKNRVIYLHGKYPCVSIYNNKFHVHRLIKAFLENRVLLKSEFVHHKNHNKLDSSLGNLEIMNDSAHQSLHNKGKKLSIEHRNKISKAGENRKGTRNKSSRPDITPEMVYLLSSQGHSFNHISKSLKLDWSCVKQRYFDHIHETPELLS
jgi:hypothetical protein